MRALRRLVGIVCLTVTLSCLTPSRAQAQYFGFYGPSYYYRAPSYFYRGPSYFYTGPRYGYVPPAYSYSYGLRPVYNPGVYRYFYNPGFYQYRFGPYSGYSLYRPPTYGFYYLR